MRCLFGKAYTPKPRGALFAATLLTNVVMDDDNDDDDALPRITTRECKDTHTNTTEKWQSVERKATQPTGELEWGSLEQKTSRGETQVNCSALVLMSMPSYHTANNTYTILLAVCWMLGWWLGSWSGRVRSRMPHHVHDGGDRVRERRKGWLLDLFVYSIVRTACVG